MEDVSIHFFCGLICFCGGVIFFARISSVSPSSEGEIDAIGRSLPSTLALLRRHVVLLARGEKDPLFSRDFSAEFQMDFFLFFQMRPTVFSVATYVVDLSCLAGFLSFCTPNSTPSGISRHANLLQAVIPHPSSMIASERGPETTKELFATSSRDGTEGEMTLQGVQYGTEEELEQGFSDRAGPFRITQVVVESLSILQAEKQPLVIDSSSSVRVNLHEAYLPTFSNTSMSVYESLLDEFLSPPRVPFLCCLFRVAAIHGLMFRCCCCLFPCSLPRVAAKNGWIVCLVFVHSHTLCVCLELLFFFGDP